MAPQWVKCPVGTGRIWSQRWSFIFVLFTTSHSSAFIFSMLLMGQSDSSMEFTSLNSYKNLIALFNHHFHWAYLTKFRLAAFLSGVDYTFDQRAESRLMWWEHGPLIHGTAWGLVPQHSREWEVEAKYLLKKRLANPKYILQFSIPKPWIILRCSLQELEEGQSCHSSSSHRTSGMDPCDTTRARPQKDTGECAHPQQGTSTCL